MLEDKVPAPFAPRPIQKRILSEIESCIESGYPNIVLCAPTGVGKSLVGVTVARHFRWLVCGYGLKKPPEPVRGGLCVSQPRQGQVELCLPPDNVRTEDGRRGVRGAQRDDVRGKGAALQKRRSAASRSWTHASSSPRSSRWTRTTAPLSRARTMCKSTGGCSRPTPSGTIRRIFRL